MKYKLIVSTVFLVLIISFVTNFAQDASKPVRLMVMQDVVHPYKVAEYEKAQKEMNEFITKNNFGFSWEVFRADDYTYHYVIPFSNFADLDRLFKMWDEKNKAANQEDLAKHIIAFTGTIDHTNTIIVKKSEYSYVAKTPYLKQDEAKFIHWDYFEILPGKEHEAWSLVSDYKKLCEKLNINVSHNVWSLEFGEHNSTIIFTTWAKDAVDFYTMNKKSNEQMMKDGSDLYSKFMACVSRFHHVNGRYEKDLSIKPQ